MGKHLNCIWSCKRSSSLQISCCGRTLNIFECLRIVRAGLGGFMTPLIDKQRTHGIYSEHITGEVFNTRRRFNEKRVRLDLQPCPPKSLCQLRAMSSSCSTRYSILLWRLAWCWVRAANELEVQNARINWHLSSGIYTVVYLGTVYIYCEWMTHNLLFC